MGLFNRRKRHAAWDRGSTREDIKHLEEFTRTRTGVEAYLEPVTMATETTLLEAISKPSIEISKPIQAFEAGLAHEKHITGCIHDLYDLAVAERDYPLQTLLHWFIDEQVEEEETAQEIIDNLRLAGETGEGLLLIDRELGQRTPEAEEA